MANDEARFASTDALIKEYREKKLRMEQEQAQLNEMLRKLKQRLADEKRHALAREVSSSSKANVKSDNSNTLLYTYNSRIGRITLDESGVVLVSEFVSGLIDLPDQLNNKKSASARSRLKYEVATHGCSMSWVPNTHELTIKNRTAKKEKDSKIMSKLEDLFNKEISTWSHEAQRWMTACNIFGYGCSDEATIMIMAGTIKALFVQLGIDIDEKRIAKAMPSRATLYNMEVRAAADCILGVCQEMKEDEVSCIGLQADHGHRQDQDHFVKLVCWAGRGAKNKPTLKFHCLDVVSILYYFISLQYIMHLTIYAKNTGFKWSYGC